MTYNIRDYGAVSDGRTINTAAINNAIQACARNGGGRVVIPAGGVFMSGTIWLQSHVELYLERGATLKASGDFRDYCTEDDYPQNYGAHGEEWTGAHLIVALECEDVAITGGGLIDGNVGAFVTEADTQHTGDIAHRYVWFLGCRRAIRPGQTIAMVECRNVQVRDITMRNLPSWCLFLFGCDYVQVRGITVINEPVVFNTDGMDIDTCRYVTVSDCLIDTGDDAIAIRNAGFRLKEKNRVCEYITITNCVLAACSSVFRIGVGRGDPIRHIRISNITAHRGAVLAYFCTEYGKTSRTPMDDIHFSNISATGVARPINLTTCTGVEVRNITLSNIRCEARASSYIWTEVPGCIRDVTLRDIDINMVDDDLDVCEAPEGAGMEHKFEVQNIEVDVQMRDDSEVSNQARTIRGEYALDIKSIEGLTMDRVRVFVSDQEIAKWSGTVRVQDCPDAVQKDCRF